MTTVGKFLTVYPMFADREQAVVQEAIALSQEVCPALYWQKLGVAQARIDRLIFLHAAHLLTVSYFQTAEMAGQAASIGEGGGAPFPTSKGENDLDSSTYGQQFKRLRRSWIPSVGFAL